MAATLALLLCTHRQCKARHSGLQYTASRRAEARSRRPHAGHTRCSGAPNRGESVTNTNPARLSGDPPDHRRTGPRPGTRDLADNVQFNARSTS
jgi:hypothetical protein